MKIRDRVKELRRVRAGDLAPHPQNWRMHPKAQQEALRGVLAEIGYADALLARELDDGRLQLIDGHLRAETTPDMTVPVLVLDVTEEEAKKLLATLDPLAGLAVADPDKLEALVAEVSFESEAVRQMLGDLSREAAAAAHQSVVEDEVPEPLPVSVSRPGDLWLLGEGQKQHRLLCGDSTTAEAVDRLMGTDRAALVATDPPYLVDYTGDRPKHGDRETGKDWSGVYREIDIKDPVQFFTAVFTHVIRVMAARAPIYCWHAHRRYSLIQRIWEELGILDHQQIVWVKPSPVFGRVYWHFRHESCMMGWVRGSQPRHDRDHTFDSVWELGWERGGGAATPDLEAASTARPVDNEHPTQKPVELFARPMRRHTRIGDVCFEPFSGSGTQLIAAEQLGRRCLAMEIEPVFVDVAVRRWQKFTGREAVHAESKLTWSQVAAERGVAVPGEARPGGRASVERRPKKQRGATRKAESPAAGPVD